MDQEWYETSTIEDTQIANKYIKICSISCYIKKIKQWNTTTFLLQWLKSETLKTPNAGKDGSNKNSHLFFIGTQSGTASLDYTFTVIYKTKHTITIWPSKYTFGIYP